MDTFDASKEKTLSDLNIEQLLNGAVHRLIDNITMLRVITIIHVVFMVLVSGLSVYLVKRLQVAPSDVLSSVDNLQHTVSAIEWSRSDADFIYATIEDSDAACIRADYNGNIITWTVGAGRMFNIHRIDTIGKQIFSILPYYDATEHRRKYLAKMQADGKPFHEFMSTEHDGVYYNITLIGIPKREVMAIITKGK